MVLLRGDETSEEIIPLAYGMEEGLAEFLRSHGTKGAGIRLHRSSS